jgi:hypothetical protein
MATNTPNLNLIKPDLTDPVDIGDINSNMDTLDELGLGYRFVQQVRFTSNGQFVKADYPWLRAIRVRCVGGGGAGGGVDATGAGTINCAAGGGSGGYSESFITDIAGLDASVTVTRGGGGAGVSAGNGNNGVASSFGSLVVANPGSGGDRDAAVSSPPQGQRGALGGAAGVGDLTIAGGSGGAILVTNATKTFVNTGGHGAASYFGGGGRPPRTGTGSVNGESGLAIGSGGSGAATLQNQVARTGGAGANGIVIVDLYA